MNGRLRRFRLFRLLLGAVGLLCVLIPVRANAQSRLALLQAEDRRAPTAADLATLRSGARSDNPQLARTAVRGLGRLERPALIADILGSLRHAAPDVRAEAANAVGQAAQGWKTNPPATAVLDNALATLAARLKVDGDADVRAALAETIGRIPYASAPQADKADHVLVDFAARAETVTDRLGAAKGLEALARVSRKLHPLSADAITALKHFVLPGGADATTAARVRRLALEGLITAAATDEALVATALADGDAQVRRIAARVAPPAALVSAATDDAPMVRVEALRALTTKKAVQACSVAVSAAADRDLTVALIAIDQLAACGASESALAVLDGAVTDRAAAATPRGWHRAAHAVVALATAAPERGRAVLGQFTGSSVWQMRMYAARAAATLNERAALEKLAEDADDNVRETAVDGLRTLYGHDADRLYIAQLTRPGYQAVRAGALALAGTPNREPAIVALKASLDRLIAEARDNSHDARGALAKTLTALGEKVPPAATEPFVKPGGQSDLNADDLRRFAAPRARLTLRGVGTVELALFPAQAPATVLRFARLAQAGYFNGLTFHRVVPNFVIQGGSPGANEYIGDSPFMRDELGLWPHVRGAVGISTRGRDTGDAQIFIDLVDNPRLDHEFTVFAQVLNGIDVVDRIVEGDVIERVEILGAQ